MILYPLGETIMKYKLFTYMRWYVLIPFIIVAANIAAPLYDATHKLPKAKFVDLAQVKCLAVNIFHEARNESTIGQAAVARVVVNRVNHGFANSVCSVVYQSTINTDGNKICQFSWVCENKNKPNDRDPQYLRAKHIAYEVLALDMYKDIVPKSALFFHAKHVDPMWPYRKVVEIGNHIFYSKQKKANK